MFPIGNTYIIGKVIRRKINPSGNVIEKMNDNRIIDTHKYCVELDDKEFSKLTANIIIEFMYAACDDYGNEYLIMELIVD